VARLESVTHALTDARRILRDRLRRYLPSSANMGARRQRPASRSTDEIVLRLLRDVTIEFGDDVESFRERYERARKDRPGAPSFDELVAAGWFRPIWRRVLTPLDTARLVASQPDDMRQALLAAMEGRHHRTIEPGTDPELKALAEQLALDRPDPGLLQSPSPSWVAARLWEGVPPAIGTPADRLRYWMDRWHLLDSPEIKPGRDWDTASAQRFADAALAVLAIDPGFLGWEQLRIHLVARTAITSRRPISEVTSSVGPVPSSMVDRVRWLDNRGFEHVRDDHDAFADLWGPARILLREVADVDMSLAPNPLAKQVLDLAIEKPELLDFVILIAHQRPVLLADILLHPRLAAAACMWIATWPLVGSAWDREALARDDAAAKLMAFSDAVGVLGQYLETLATPPAECAALLAWMHGAATVWSSGFQRAPVVGPQMFGALRGELLALPAAVIRGIFDALAASPGGLGSPSFAAAIDVLALGALADVVDPSPLVDAYTASLRSRDFSVSAARIEPAGAQAVVQLALRADEERQRAFLAPLDVNATLASTDPNDTFSVTDGLGRSLRAHIRVLARAIAVWPEAPPATLVGALAASIRAGALSHVEKGRVPAFSARYETGLLAGPADKPIALDLAEALAALEGDLREGILSAVLETDEPLTLAQLYTVAPASVRGRLKERILQLPPKHAAGVMTLPEAQARVEALLAAGLTDAAATFMEAEQDLKTLGPVQGRTLAQLRARLRLNLIRGELAAILGASVADLPSAEQAEGADALDFYKALAHLSGHPPDAAGARQIFERLHRRRPDIASYVVNMLAAETSALLAGNLFGSLRGANVSRARRALADADAAMTRCRGVGEEDRGIHECNRALLLLATGDPDRAHQGLLRVRGGQREERVAAYTAVALSRMARPEEAIAAIDRAVAAFGKTELLAAARAQIRGGVAFDARPTTTSVEDPLPSLRAALNQILVLDSVRQAALFESPPDPFDNMLINHVRSAAASVVGLVPMLKYVEVDSCEDDLSAMLLAILRARLEFIRWSVNDQAAGGFTASGGPGRRDITIMRDSAILAVLEAVVCARPATTQWSQGELISHFQKVLGYATCRMFFHVTYAYVDVPSAIIAELKRAAQSQAPSGFEYDGLVDIPLTDSRPTGFVASYKSGLGDKRVVFLIMEMQQRSERGAAKLADTTNPRKRKAGPKRSQKK
jgi:hypothetical protein